MKYGIDEYGKFYVEYTACSRPIGTVREELEAACVRVAKDTDILIHLSGGLDSQILVHSFHSLGLDYQAAFLYHPGYNETELEQVRFLERKYGFKCIVISMNPDQHRAEAENYSLRTGIPPEHYLMNLFTEQLPGNCDILQGIDSPDLIFKSDGKCYCLEAWTTIALARMRSLDMVQRKGRIVAIDRRAEFNEFALAYLTDPVVDGYINSISYTLGNGLVEKESGEAPPVPFYWEYFVKPLIIGTHWKKELEYFPKFSSQRQIDWICNPADIKFRHQYRQQQIQINRDELVEHLTQWGTNKIKRWSEP